MSWIDLKSGEAIVPMIANAIFTTDKDIATVVQQLHNHRDQLVAISFLQFKDGRGFSLAHLLRRQYGFSGRLVAVGNLLPDQAQFLYRAGFDLADVGVKKIADWQQAIKSFSVFYQQAIR